MGFTVSDLYIIRLLNAHSVSRPVLVGSGCKTVNITDVSLLSRNFQCSMFITSKTTQKLPV